MKARIINFKSIYRKVTGIVPERYKEINVTAEHATAPPGFKPLGWTWSASTIAPMEIYIPDEEYKTQSELEKP